MLVEQSRLDGSAGAFAAFLPVLVKGPHGMNEIEDDNLVGGASVFKGGKALFGIHDGSPSRPILPSLTAESIGSRP